MRYLLDTNIFIYHLNGDIVATDFIQENLKNSSLSFIAYIEVLSYKYTPGEELRIRKFLNAFSVIEIKQGNNRSLCQDTESPEDETAGLYNSRNSLVWRFFLGDKKHFRLQDRRA
ncbi:MAG: hypothetical protein A2X48_24280 [Lentisphaerae bacterium GWF2_49_21]|nr:MAG: hypothetical protein A2X48_24280 [Lentisphaerae bacterium GWF2_49_21]